MNEESPRLLMAEKSGEGDKPKVRAPKFVEKAWEETEAETVADIVTSLILTDLENDILKGFVQVFNRRRRQRREQKAHGRVKRLLDAERLDDTLEGYGQLGPTPQTLRNLRSDVVLRLFEQGKITRPEEMAAEEIREARQAIMRALFPSRRMEPMAAKVKGVWRGLSGIERLTEAEEVKWRRYIEWAQGMTRRGNTGCELKR